MQFCWNHWHSTVIAHYHENIQLWTVNEMFQRAFCFLVLQGRTGTDDASQKRPTVTAAPTSPPSFTTPSSRSSNRRTNSITGNLPPRHPPPPSLGRTLSRSCCTGRRARPCRSGWRQSTKPPLRGSGLPPRRRERWRRSQRKGSRLLQIRWIIYRRHGCRWLD